MADMRQDGLEKLTKCERGLYDAMFTTNPPLKLSIAAKSCGIKAQTAWNYFSRIRTKLGYDPRAEFKALGKLPAQRNGKLPPEENLYRVMPETLRRLTEMRLKEALVGMKEKQGEATYAELSRAAKDLNITRAQLAGEPTQILSVDARVKMLGVLQLVNAEATRRGMVKVQGEAGELTAYKKLPATVDVEPSA